MKQTLLLFPLLTLTAAMVQAAPSVTLYEGKTADQSKLAIAPYGAGAASESKETYLQNGQSLKVTTLDPYQGARFTLADAVPLSGDKQTLQITIRRGGATLHYDPRITPNYAPGEEAPAPERGGGNYPGGGYPGGGYPGGGYPGGGGGDAGQRPNAGNYPGGGYPGGGYPGGGYPGGGYPGGGYPGGGGGDAGQRPNAGNYPGGGYPGGGNTGGGRRGGFGQRGNNGNSGATRNGRAAQDGPLIPNITQMHVLLTLADGRQADALVPIPEKADESAGANWYTVSVPVSQLKFAKGEAPQLKTITVAGDQFGVFFIGRMMLADSK